MGGTWRLRVLMFLWISGSDGKGGWPEEYRPLKYLEKCGYARQARNGRWYITQDGRDRLLAPMKLVKNEAREEVVRLAVHWADCKERGTLDELKDQEGALLAAVRDLSK